MRLMSCIFCSFHGGYMKLNSVKKLLLRTGFPWLNMSNVNLPWYFPNPLSPTPPNGMVSQAYYNHNNNRVFSHVLPQAYHEHLVLSKIFFFLMQQMYFTCNRVSLKVRDPEDVSSRTRLFSFSLLVKA